MIYNSVLEMIGNTPVVRINKLNPYEGVEIYAKLEGGNPGGSIKDRIAYQMISEAIKSGELNHDKTIIEATSGNTGIGLAMVASVLGYDIEIVMSAAVSIERRKMLEALGAKVILSPAIEGTDGAIRLTREIVSRSPHKYFLTDQYSNENNVLAHYYGTAKEIIKDVPTITHFVASLGTTGTLMGTSRRLKDYRRDIQAIAVEPNRGHKIQGLKSLEEAEVPAIFNKADLDERIIVNDKDAYQMTRKLAKEEGLFVGMSSGAALAGALRIARRLSQGNQKGVIVTMFPDKGEKYLSTALFKGDKMGMKLFNTLTLEKEDFVPLKKNLVGMYSCGPTVYNYAHIGNLRSFIFSDILKRYLRYKGYHVNHVMNITDVDDKTIRDSKKEGKPLKEFTEYYTDEFFKDFDALHIEKPNIIPKATEHIDDMVAIIKDLLDKGIAYKSDDGSIYFSIRKFTEYGKLSHTKVDDLKAGARVSQDEYEKGNLSDFALWKGYSEDDGDVFWETEIGKGRPGWHIECSAMSTKYLGENFDIHTGGIDLVFPHHENEIAQSEAVSKKTMVNYWVHCEHLLVDGKKMAKSAGNFYTLRDVLEKGFSPLGVRYVLLATHYRQQLNFTFEGLKAAENTIQRIKDFMQKLHEIESEKESEGVKNLLVEVREGFEKNMDDNLNTSAALASIFEFMRKMNRLISNDRLGAGNAAEITSMMERFDSVLGILDKKEDVVDEEIEALIEEREQARTNKDFALADEIRDSLREKGIILEDAKGKTRWKRMN